MEYHWPGNIRELRNAIESALVLARGENIELKDLPGYVTGSQTIEDGAPWHLADLPYRQAKEMTIKAFEKRYCQSVLNKADGNISQASRMAGLDRSNFKRLLRKTKSEL